MCVYIYSKHIHVEAKDGCVTRTALYIESWFYSSNIDLIIELTKVLV